MESFMETPPLDELILLKKIHEDPAVAAYVSAITEDNPCRYAQAYAALLEKDRQRGLSDYIARLILFDDNLFSRRAFSGNLTDDLLAAYRHDLTILAKVCDSTERLPQKIAGRIAEGLPRIYRGKSEAIFGDDWTSSETLTALSEFYKKNGYGKFIGNKAFVYEHGTLQPVKNTPAISLSDLKDYENEKRVIGENIINFIEGLPFSNMLLYGDKGTGKSSTVHAFLNKYADQGLRAVEIAKNQIKEINPLKELLAPLPFHFLIFIDDLSLEEHDENVTYLKASLEGSVNERSANIMIVATSNRRHILKENFSDRENSVHASDTMEEQLSLSDRFGLTVLFSSTDKFSYLSIVRQLAQDKKLDIPEETLFALAERWALYKGGRSPRRAKQFIDFAYSCRMRNTEITF